MDIQNEVSRKYQHPVELLQKLVQFDTSNPPGNEADCILFINELLTQAGIETKILAKSSDRPNLIARLPGQGNAAPLMLYGHVDVVTTEKQQWQHPPFEGKLVDGYLWGRGALDMKGGIAMMLAACLRVKAENIKPQGDIVLTIVSDEEGGGDFGSKWLAENHSEEFFGIRYAIGEFGGFTLSVGKHRFYAIQIAEKQICWTKVTTHGLGGHGSMPVHGGAIAKISRFLQQLDSKQFPVHITPPAHLMFSTMSSKIGGAKGFMIRQLLNPKLTNSVLKLLGERGHIFDPLFRNTVSPTILKGSDKINVIPSEVSVELDGRLLPGFKPEDIVNELKHIVKEEIEVEVVRYDPCPARPDMGLFDTLSLILKESDPNGTALPFFLSGCTDARFFSRLGIQTYGFLPMPLPDNFNFANFIHAADERIPIDAIQFGANAIYRLLQLYQS